MVLLLAGIALYGQGIVGTWEGSSTLPTPDGGEVTLRIAFHLKATEDGYTSTMDSPDQNAFDLPTTSTTFTEKKLVIKKDDIMFEYAGTLVDDKNVNGSFTQAGMEFELNLVKKVE
jgi:hypothetical protein